MSLLFVIAILSITQVYTTLKAGESIDKALQGMGIRDSVRAEIIRAMRGEINLRRCRPGDKLYITKTDGRFVKLKYEQSRAIWIVDSLMRVSKLPEVSKLVFLEGVVETGNLWDALISAKGTPQLVYKFADEVFPWDIDFNVETRNGDKFEVLVTAKYIEDKFVGYGQIFYARYISGRQDFSGIYYVRSGYYNLEGKSLQRLFLKAPVSYIRIASGYSLRRLHPILRRWMPHQGVDYSAPIGTPIRTIGDGRVTFAGWKKGFGRQVIIKHGSGFTSYYGHLSRFAKGIRSGKYVKQGELIGYVGSSGLSTGAHLDFRLNKHGSWLNPLKLTPPRVDPLKGEKLDEYKDYVKSLQTLMAGLKVLEKLPQIL